MEKRVSNTIELPGADATLRFEIEEMGEFFIVSIEQYTSGKRDLVTEQILEREDLEGLKNTIEFMLKEKH